MRKGDLGLHGMTGNKKVSASLASDHDEGQSQGYSAFTSVEKPP